MKQVEKTALHFSRRSAPAALLLFFIAVLLAVGPATVRGQSALDGFDPNANLPVLVVVVQPDGKILLGGSFTMLSPNGGVTVSRNRIARLNPDGTLDTGFNPNANLDVNAIALQVDGKILLGGFFTTLSPNGGAAVTRNRIARLNPNGTLDTAFDPNASGSVRSIAVQANAQILAGGQFTTIGGQTRNRIARLNATTGAPDSFNPNANNTVFAIALQADGKILAGGFFTSIGGQTRNRIARLDATTGLADSFDPTANNGVYSIALQPDGRILAGGDFNGTNSIGGATRNRIARLDATTGLADSFNPNANLGVFAIAVQVDGKILAGGDFSSIGGQTRSRIARLDAMTGAADSFDPNANANASVYAVAVQTDGKILVGGNFSSIGGQMRNHIARLETNGRIPYVVNTTSDTVVAGACGFGGANCSLRGAIQAANSQPGVNEIEIDLPAGSVINLTAALPDITESVSISGPGADNLTVRRNSAAGYSVFKVTAGPVSFSGLTISNGSASNGGGINQTGTTVNVTNCTFTGNVAGNGGWIYNNGRTLNVTNCTFTGNGANADGGGIANDFYGTANVSNSTFNGNIANNGDPTASGGGAICNGDHNHSQGGFLTVTNTTITGNTALRGGGLSMGGAAAAGSLTVTNSTIVGNSSFYSDSAGGISSDGQGPLVNIKNTIVALNTGAAGRDVYAAFASSGFNLIGRVDGGTGFNDPTDQTGTIASPLDPNLDPAGLQNNGGPTQTIALQFGSPAIDKGTSNGLTGTLSTDQRGAGFPRIFDNPSIPNATGGDGADIGAFEIQPTSINISGTISYCTNPNLNPVPDVTLTLTGSASGSTLSNASGNYTFSSLASGGNYTVTPTKAALAPASAGINTTDVIVVQRHFLNVGTPLTGCRLTAADVTGDTVINTNDVIAIQRFFLGLSTGIANVGKYKFTPVNRTYIGLVSNQTGQNYDTLVFGDTASSFVELVDGPLQTETDNGTGADEVPATTFKNPQRFANR